MKLYIWGMGIKFSLLKDRIINMNEVVGFIDNNFSGPLYLNKPVYRPEEILDKEYDAIVIANNSTESIYRQCLMLGIHLDKVIFLYKNWKFEFLQDNQALTQKIFGKEFSDFLRNKYHIVNSTTLDEVNYSRCSAFQNDPLFRDDYIRIGSLMFAAEEIEKNQVEGAVAELGVFRGDFACNINRVFPDRKLYLFDTFEGFNEDEAQKEKEHATCNDAYIDAFRKTNLDIVIEKMPYKEMIEIKAGFFPNSLNGLEETFAFVSLDVDFEDSTYAGLEYFYPRLSWGGYIFVHDYNYGYFESVKNAIKKYEQTKGIKLAKVPICDYNGTVVITK